MAARAEGFRAFASVPLRSNFKTYGTLNVHSRLEREFVEEDVQLLTSMAAQIGLAVANTRLYLGLQASERKFRGLVENAGDVIYLTDRDGRLTYMNPAAATLLGWDPNELCAEARSVLALVHPDDLAAMTTALERMLGGEIMRAFEFRMVRASGGFRWVSQTNVPLRDEHGTVIGMQGIAHDITDRRKMHDQMARAERLADLGRMAAGIAHEIRNPLVAVKTFLDLLPSRSGDKEFMTNFRDLSLTELRRVTDLITDLLALGKSAAADRRSVDLGPIIEPIARLMDSTARKRGVEIVSQIQAGIPAVHADPDQMKQIILNLVLNAIDASPEGGRVMLALRTPRTGRDRVVLEVRDEGPGIPPDKLKSIFHPFFTTKDTGTGLGLALAHQMIVEHGGEIVVESELGKGSVFRVTLPTESVTLAKTGT
jgi:two-component system sporulation sensor kinase A